MSHDIDDPRPTDPSFLFAILLAARKSRDRMLESLAREWLGACGIHVVFADELNPPTPTSEENRRDD